MGSLCEERSLVHLKYGLPSAWMLHQALCLVKRMCPSSLNQSGYCKMVSHLTPPVRVR